MIICVYCASSSQISESYHSVAEQVGALLAHGQHTLVYGGGSVGLMGSLARSVHKHSGRVVGVIPRALQQIEGRAYDIADELVVTETMQERKRILFTRAETFLILPGGIGTLEEFFEVLTLRKLGYHDKRISILNVEGFFDPLLQLLDHLHETGFSPDITDGSLYVVSSSAEDAIDYLTGTSLDD